MSKAETLSEIKRAEADVRGMKDAAEKEKDRILREARREVLELQEALRREAEAAAATVLRGAGEGIAKERDAVLAQGRERAETLKAAGMKNVDRAADLVVAKFQGALDA